MKRIAPLFLVALAGCFGPLIGPIDCGGGTVVDPLEDIDVKSAHFDVVTLSHDELIEGHVTGTGTVVVIDTGGAEHDFAATIDGSLNGAGIDTASLAGLSFPFQLPKDESVNARELLGEYTGAHFGVGVGAGAEYADLKNDSDVHLNVAALSQGFGIDAGSLEDVTIALVDDPRHTVDDGVNFFPIDLGPGNQGTSTSDRNCPASGSDGCGTDDDCCSTETCLPTGGCATTCGSFSVDDTGALHIYKDPDGMNPACPNGATCQAYSATFDGAVLVVACMPRTLTRGAPCFDIYDDKDGGGACADGLDCMPTAVPANGEYIAFTCEEPCSTDADCAGGETCVTSTTTMPDGSPLSSCRPPP